ncbi:TPA: hypothetical protein N0F65_005301 [Lagenidium giganteum]|uniref:Uncharacterized protein n=1 Tax=Lagenidium giganteum TaxID=4803 RepID=A0AAV2Z0Z6_9STRA|nr:TPA: hypothetical protein N0F65_005301 [Lagenidium giganteum]
MLIALQTGLVVTQQSVRERQEALTKLQSRVQRMARSLQDQSEERSFAITKLALEEQIRSEQLSLHECKKCNKKFLGSLYVAHEASCTGRRKPTYMPELPREIAIPKSGASSSNPITPSTCFISQPPRYLRVDARGIGHNTITIKWDLPIFTGSNLIIDYKVHISKIVAERQKDKGVVTRLEGLPTFHMAAWCVKQPLIPNEFVITGLEADQEYGDIAICAMTQHGTSARSNAIDSLRTAPPVAPTRPLFLTVGAVTAKTVTLSWIEPFDTGGKPIVEYEIALVEAVMEEATSGNRRKFLDVSEVVYKPRRIRTRSPETTFMVDDLLSGKEHKDFQVRAVNAAGIPGDFSASIPSIITIRSEFKLLDELHAAVNARGHIVDSHFLSGFMQRYERSHYIELVSKFIMQVHPHLEAKVNAILARAGPPNTPEAIAAGPIGDIQVLPARRREYKQLTDEELIQERRRQFRFRISDIEQELKKAEYNVQWCKERRLDLVALIRRAENRILEKQAELERARLFKGSQMDSDVLENGRERFVTRELIISLEDEIEIEQLYIVDTKSEIIKVENYLRADTKRREKTLARLEDRRRALIEFEKCPTPMEEKDPRLQSVNTLRGSLLHRMFNALAENRRKGLEVKQKMRAALDHFVNHKKRSALRQWRDVSRWLQHEEASSGGGVFGVGSAGLLSATVGRDELLFEAHDLLGRLRQTTSDLKTIPWTEDQNKREKSVDGVEVDETQEKYYPFLLKADAKMELGSYEGALQLYTFMLGNSRWTSRMSSRRVFQLLLKTGECSYHLGNHEHALIKLNRASIIAAESGRREDKGHALLATGHVYLATRTLRQSMECYEQALMIFDAVRDSKAQLSCYRGLQHVYGMLEDSEMAEQNKRQADAIEFALNDKLSDTGKRLDKLQQRLVGVGAESSKTIELERVGAIVPRLRRNRILTKFSIREEHKLIVSLEKLLEEKKSLFIQGEEDLKRALASDSNLVDSCVITGSNARFEIDDFKKKLAKLMGYVKAGEEHVLKEINNSKIRISNAEDAIKEFEAELLVETGALMRQMLSKERLRCFCFNVTNEALKNVIGTASNGISTCVAAAGLNAPVFDLLSGACLTLALGDPKKEHLGAPVGHQAQIVCIYYIGQRIYTGSMDASLGVWKVQDESIGGYSCVLLRLLTDFDAAVVSVAADSHWIAGGSSDCDIVLFDASTFAVIARVISAHSRSVTALVLHSSKNTFTTGSADFRLKIWNVGESIGNTARRRVKMDVCLQAERKGDVYFNGHVNPITCVKQVTSEIVSGDTGGRIVIWNLETDNKLLRVCDVHQTPVVCLQFDATRVVSGGADGSICITDFATGHLVQTLHGHSDTILDLQFDRKRLVSVSADGKLRLWYWQARLGVNGDRRRYHILGAGETLRSLSLKYRSSIENLLRWNGLPDSSKMYLGQKLVVQIDPDNGASDELNSLDMRVSTQYGKLLYEDLDFVAANKAQKQDVESQWAAHRVALMAKEYFPPLEDDEAKPDVDEEEESDSDSGIAISSDEESAGDEEKSGDDDDAEGDDGDGDSQKEK